MAYWRDEQWTAINHKTNQLADPFSEVSCRKGWKEENSVNQACQSRRKRRKGRKNAKDKPP
jgi:hypothetical protein